MILPFVSYLSQCLVDLLICCHINILYTAAVDMSHHCEIPQLRLLAKVIRSNVWVGNDRLINLLVNIISPLGRDAVQQTFTSQFWTTVIQDNSSDQLETPSITPASLQTLVDSQLWRDHAHIAEFILHHYHNFTEQERTNFGTFDFGNFIAANIDQFGAGAAEFYQIGVEGRIRVQRFNSDNF